MAISCRVQNTKELRLLSQSADSFQAIRHKPQLVIHKTNSKASFSPPNFSNKCELLRAEVDIHNAFFVITCGKCHTVRSLANTPHLDVGYLSPGLQRCTAPDCIIAQCISSADHQVQGPLHAEECQTRCAGTEFDGEGVHGASALGAQWKRKQAKPVRGTLLIVHMLNTVGSICLHAQWSVPAHLAGSVPSLGSSSAYSIICAANKVAELHTCSH
eukprot:1158263-Pelagomonas_calceolata.AAC.13